MSDDASGKEKPKQVDAAKKTRHRVRVFFRAAVIICVVFALLTVTLAIVGPGSTGGIHAAWLWLSFVPPGVDAAALASISGVAAVIWTGGLIAFTLQQRYTSDLSNGMWALVYAFATPLTALSVSGPTLRVVGFTVGVLTGILAAFQILLFVSLRRQSKSQFKLSGTFTPLDGSVMTLTEEQQRRMVQRLTDALNRIMQGGALTGPTAGISLAIFVYPSTTTVAVGSLAALILGLNNVYNVVTRGFRVGGDAEDGLFVPDTSRARP
jgi:hypothetical protein